LKSWLIIIAAARRGACWRDDALEMKPRKDDTTFADVRINKKLSSRAQKLATVPQTEFGEKMRDWRGEVKMASDIFLSGSFFVRLPIPPYLQELSPRTIARSRTHLHCHQRTPAPAYIHSQACEGLY
jgi:hypothetical protein